MKYLLILFLLFLSLGSQSISKVCTERIIELEKKNFALEDTIKKRDIDLLHRQVELEVMIDFYKKHEVKIDSQKTHFNKNVKASVDQEIKIERIIRSSAEALVGVISAIAALLAIFYRKKLKAK